MKHFKLDKVQLDEIVKQYNFSNNYSSLNFHEKENILISGATGFLATHLVAYLLLDKRIKNIYALVRNEDKLLFNLQTYGIIKDNVFQKNFLDTLNHIDNTFIENDNFNKLFNQKIHFLIGDITKQNWAIDLNKINTDVHLVMHLGAKISALDLLTHTKANNCDSTYYGIQLASQFKCPFMLASTLSTFVSSSSFQGHFYEFDRLNEDKHYLGGYAQSKYISEQLAYQYPSQIIRYGLLTGSSFKGQFPDNTFFELFVRWIKRYKVLPKNYEESFVDITPVDIAALITKELIFKGNDTFLNNVYHIANSESLSINRLIDLILLENKNEIQYLEYDDFMVYLTQFKKFEQIFFEYAFFKTKAMKKYPHYFNIDLFQSTHCVFHKENLSNLGLDYLKNFNDNLINLYLESYYE